MKEGEHFWRPAKGPSEIEGSEIHVWRISLDRPPVSIESLREILSPDEKLRVESFHFPKDGESYCICRGYLRTLLGRYTGVDPAAVELSRGEHGKLFLAPPRARDGLQFNVSHSGRIALFALAQGRRVGTDVEKVREIVPDEIAGAFFSDRESRIIHALPKDTRDAAFFACWTRKEAAVKALGGSIMELSEKVVVSVSPDEPARLLAMPSNEAGNRWSLVDLPAGEGYSAALCYEGAGGALFLWESNEK